MSTVAGVRVLHGVTGGIAAYKAAGLTSRLRQEGAEVRVMMTANAQRFVTPLTFEALCGYPVYTEMWDMAQYEVEHVAVADWAQIVVVAPATANVLAKAAHGLCDDFLSTTLCATRAPVVFAPAMTTTMWDNPMTQRNVTLLHEVGCEFVGPGSGWLACGKQGEGRMVEPDAIYEHVLERLRRLAQSLRA